MKKYIDEIDSVLKDLEDRGEIVLVSSRPGFVSKTIFSAVIKSIIEEKEESEFIIECDIPYLLEQIAENIRSVFSEDAESSKCIANNFYHRLLNRLSMREVAELIHHETPFEIALLSYYCVKFDRGDSRDFKYMDWRKKYYRKRVIAT